MRQGYLWNSGNFVFRAEVMLEELERFEPEIAAAAREGVARAKTDLGFIVLDREFFVRAPKMSIDFAVMERTHRAAVLAADVGWSDVGQWSTVWRLSPQDERGNSLRGRAVAIDSSNVLVRSEDQLAAVIGLDNVIVIATDDAVLVADQGHSDKVKELVERLKAERHPEATHHRRIYRPWGYYQSIDRGDRYQVKRIVVRPGGRLSLQKHYHRAEHWVVVNGAAEVTLGGAVRLVHENEFDLPADRLRPPPRQSRQDRSRTDRGADRQLPRRGRHRPYRRRVQPGVTGAAPARPGLFRGVDIQLLAREPDVAKGGVSDLQASPGKSPVSA